MGRPRYLTDLCVVRVSPIKKGMNTTEVATTAILPIQSVLPQLVKLQQDNKKDLCQVFEEHKANVGLLRTDEGLGRQLEGAHGGLLGKEV